MANPEGTFGRARIDLMKRYFILAYGAFGTMGGVGLMVLGSLLVGVAIAVLLAGFGIADVIGADLSTGEMLISAIVLAVMGLFCLGVASEGPLGRGRRLVGFEAWELGIGRAVAVFVSGLIALFLYNLVAGALENVPVPLYQGTEGFRAVGLAGITVMPLIGVPLSIALQYLPDRYAWARSADIPLLFVVWTVSALVLLT